MNLLIRSGLVLFLYITIIAPLHAQDFSSANYFVDTLRFRSVDEREWADLDGDEDQDLLVSPNYGQIPQLYWVENDELSFDNQRSIKVDGVGIIRIEVADMDGDGDNDIVYGSTDDDRIAWLPNDGQGGFGQEIVINNPDTDGDKYNDSNGDADYVTSLQVGDIDRDGDQDIMFGSRNKLGWYLNEGDGSFSEQQYLESDIYPKRARLVNIRGDSSLDIVMAGQVYEFQSSQGYLDPVTILSGGSRGDHYVDFDGDGFIDILTKLRVGFESVRVWYKNKGDSSFADSTSLDFGDYADGPDIQYSDIDGDRDIDLFGFNAVYDEWMWYENMGNYQFEHRRLPQPRSDTTYGKVSGTIQTNLVFSSNRQQIGYYGFDQDSALVPVTLISNPNYWGPRDVVTSDFNQDSIDDVVISFNCPNDLTVHLSQSDGTFSTTEVTSYREEKVQTCGSEVKVGDVDGDGDMDLLLLADHAYQWFINEGNGVFNQSFAFHQPETRERGWAADVNGDGFADVVVVGWLGEEIVWYENNTDQTFTRHVVKEFSNHTIQESIMADLNGDGDRDLIYLKSERLRTKIVYWENTGEGEYFESGKVLLDKVNLYNLYAADVDSDSDVDLLYGRTTGTHPDYDRRTMWLENKGGGSFASKGKRLLEHENPIIVGDLDLDGDKDIITSMEVEVPFNIYKRLFWQENEGSLQFSTPKQIEGVESGFISQLAYLSDDRSPDLLITDGWQIGWLKNNITQKNTAIKNDGSIPRSYKLDQNYPNPFNPSTTITYALPRRAKVNISLYNTLGQRVATIVDKEMNAGSQTVQFDADGFSSGVYIYRLQADGFNATKKMLLVK